MKQPVCNCFLGGKGDDPQILNIEDSTGEGVFSEGLHLRFLTSKGLVTDTV